MTAPASKPKAKKQSEKSQQDLLDELHPAFRYRVEQILHDLTALGWQPKIVFARRTEEQQRDAIARGASPTMLSWHVEQTIGLLPDGARIQVVRGNAVDIVDRRHGWEGKARDQKFKFWTDLGAAAHQHGCQWGGDWTPRKVKQKDGTYKTVGGPDVAPMFRQEVLCDSGLEQRHSSPALAC